MIRIDGAAGEGGGQILRSALSLSLLTGQPFTIENIRAGRERPGLLRQHLTAVTAAAAVGGAAVEGAALGSRSLTFRPGTVRPGEYRFAVGTAGSGTLVLQTVLPALLTAGAPSRVTVEGGTHNPAAPPYPFLERVFLPLLARMGPRFAAQLERYGFYPAGGGRFTVSVTPSAALAPLHLGPRGELTRRHITAVAANLSRKIAEREVATAAEALNWPAEGHAAEETRESDGPGNVMWIEMAGEGFAEIVTGFGQIGRSAEKVAHGAAQEARKYLASGAAAGEHLADQLLLPLAMAGAGEFTATRCNLHARTNMEVIGRFLPVRFTVREEAGLVRISL